ncbi:MAG: glycoside hydrolase family 15 protein [Anaerolineae bacterium]
MKIHAVCRPLVLLVLLLSACATSPAPAPTQVIAVPSPASTLTPTVVLPRAGEMPAAQFAKASTWAPGSKSGAGTAYTYDQPAESNHSRIWFTITNGALTDVLYPTLDLPNVRELKFLVGDGNRVFDETADLQIKITRPDPRALVWKLESTDTDNRFRLTKTIIADPAADTLMMNVQLDALKGNAGDYQLYAYLVPLLAGTGQGNKLTLDFAEHRATVTAEQAAASVVTDVPWLAATAGYLRASDGLTDLQANQKLTLNYDAATRGDYPTLTVQLPAGKPVTLALGLGANAEASLTAATGSLARGWDAVYKNYTAGWNAYCATLDPAAPAGIDQAATDEYYTSAMLLRAGEDKTYRGAVVASFAYPWSDHTLDRPQDRVNFVGYRRMWARDAYHTALGLWAAGDAATARAILKFLDEVQQKSTGYFPQNTYLDGTVSWSGLQMDEVADPILLAARLGANDRYASLVKPAADFIVQNGPSTPQERWEEASGYSPATIAAEIAALVAAGDMADKAGDGSSAATYRSTAKTWAGKLEGWTYTHNGPLGGGSYFIRISPQGKADIQDYMSISGNGGTVDQRKLVDPSFLELVRLGVLKPNDPRILATLPVVDQALKVNTPNGPSWHRYPGDRYGENGRDPTMFLLSQGHIWPLFTGERGMYELAAGHRDQAAALLTAMEKFANAGGMIPEQVWEDTGTGTGSATPLQWAHAEYILLYESLAKGTVLDRPGVVSDFFK